LIIPASSFTSVYAFNPFEGVKRAEIKTESGKVYKFDVDVRLDGGDERVITVNHKAKGDKVTLKQGEHITLRIVQSGIVNDDIFASLFDGKISIKEGLNGKIQFKGKETTFLSDNYPDDNIIHATVPSKIKKGDYKLIVNIDEGGELIFYFITAAKIKSGTGSSNNCDPAYPDFCIKSPPPDLDCADFSQKNFKVLPPDPHNLDGDGDGVGCES
jgi:hypothetical protein